jgi:hypothetical protein
MWTWPVAFVSYSLREYLYYVPLINLGLLAILGTYRAIERNRSRDYVLVGAALGMGFWLSPFVVYFVIFCALIALPKWKAWVKRAWIAVAAAVVTAAPWWTYNITHDFVSLRTPSGAPGGTYREHLEVFAREGLPRIFSLKGWWLPYWLRGDNRELGLLLLAGFLMVIAVVAVRAWRRPDVITLAAWPFVYAFSPMASTHSIYAPRYWVLIWPFLALVLARAMWNRATIAIGVAVLLFTGQAGMWDQRHRWVDWPDTAPLEQTMRERNVTDFFGSYWVAYRLTYASDERIVGTPALPIAVRWKPYDEQVRAAGNPAWVFRTGEFHEQPFVDSLRAQHVDFTSIATGGYTLYLTDRKVLPEQLPPGVVASLG